MQIEQDLFRLKTELLESFDFCKITDHKPEWINLEKSELETPSYWQIVLQAIDLIDKAYYTAIEVQDSTRYATGGFIVTAEWDAEANRVCGMSMDYSIVSSESMLEYV
jgi:hypothetical protein